MKTLEKVSDFVGKYMAGIVIVVAALALFFPGTFSVVKTAWVNTLLGIVMFGMGLTLKPEDFKVVFSRPKDVIVGCVAQFTLMPFLAWALTQVFHLPTELAIGVILVGTCPGGTSSNVMTYLSKGDVALSVGMTAVSTVLAPFLTPLLTLLYAGQRVEVNPVNMFLSIVKVVLVPIALGFVVNHFFHAFTQNAVRVLPLISTTAIVLIICAVVSANSAKIMTSGLLILAVVILHNLCGYSLGFGFSKLMYKVYPRLPLRAAEGHHLRGRHAGFRFGRHAGPELLRVQPACRRAVHLLQRMAQHLRFGAVQLVARAR